MEGFALIALVLIGLFVIYRLGLFAPVVDLSAVATRESKAYNRSHKAAVAKRYLDAELEFTTDQTNKINNNIEAIDSLKFD